MGLPDHRGGGEEGQPEGLLRRGRHRGEVPAVCGHCSFRARRSEEIPVLSSRRHLRLV